MGLRLSLGAPSVTTGTGSALVLDCQDTAMVPLVDSTPAVAACRVHRRMSFSRSPLDPAQLRASQEAQGFGQLMRTSMLSFLNDEKKNPASCFGASSSDMFF